MNSGSDWTKAAGWLAFAIACSAFFLPIVNPDIYWHLSAARQMVLTGSLPRTDFLSWTMAGAEWVNFEWLPQLLYYALYSAGGFTALFLLKAVMFSLTLLTVRASVLQHGRGSALPFALIVFAAAVVPACDIRPENFSVLFFALTLHSLEKTRLRGESAAPSLFTTVFFFALWANCHAGYVYGLALISFYAAGAWVDGKTAGRSAGGPRPALFLKLLAAGLAASMANPYGWNIFAVMLDHQRHISDLALYISEWAPFNPANSYQWPYAFSLAASAAALALFAVRGTRPPAAHLASALFFGWASLSHVRHTPFFMIAAATFCAALPWERMPLPHAGRVIKITAAAALLTLAGWFYPRLVWSRYDGRARVLALGSEGMASFLAGNGTQLSRLKMFNHWGWGGWLGWRLGPEYKVFVDGRYLFHGRLGELERLRSSPDAWRRLIEKEGLQLLLLKNDSPGVAVRQRMPDGSEREVTRPAYLFYLPRTEWALVYWDSFAFVMASRSAVSQAWLREHELSYLRPGDTHNLRAAALAGAVPLSALKREMASLLRYAGEEGTRPDRTGLATLVEDITAACDAAGTCAE